MSEKIKRIYAIIPVVAATVAIIVAIVGGISLKNENALLRNELARAEEKNRSLFSLLVKFISQGNLSLTEISPFISTVEAKDLAEKTSEAIKSYLPFDLETQFYPSGWMGDGKFGTKYLSIKHVQSSLNGKDTVATKIEYRQGPEKWAGIYWQYPDKNWGDKPGRTLLGAKSITFYAKGENGNEIVEFKSGGIRGGRYQDSFEKSLGKITLSRQWTQYVLDISKEDLKNVIGAFAWIANGDDNGGHVIVYISELRVN